MKDRIDELHALSVELRKETLDLTEAKLGFTSSDFERDVKLTRQLRQEVAAIAEMKGRYEKETETMEWAGKVLPFLSDLDKVSDDDFSLISIVINCVDKWIQSQSE